MEENSHTCISLCLCLRGREMQIVMIVRGVSIGGISARKVLLNWGCE